jgi:hypothetical protein
MPPPQQAHRRRGGATPSTSKAAAGSTAPMTGKKRKYADDSAVTPAEHPPAKRQPSTTPYANTLELRRAILRRPGANPKPAVGPSRLGRSSSSVTPAAAAHSENKHQEQCTNSPISSAMRSNKKVKFSPAPRNAAAAAGGVVAASPMAVARSNKIIPGQNTPFSRSSVVDTATPNGSVARRPTIRAVSSGRSRMGSGTGTGSRTGGGGSNTSASTTSLRVAAAIRTTKAHEAYIARMRKAQQI